MRHSTRKDVEVLSLPSSVLTAHLLLLQSVCVCGMVMAERGWVEITLLNLLCCLQSLLRVSMATHSLGNPPSKSRWSDDAVVCLCQVCSSPLCEPVGLLPSDGVKQIYGSVVHRLNKTPSNDCKNSKWLTCKELLFISNETLKLCSCDYLKICVKLLQDAQYSLRVARWIPFQRHFL